MRRSILFIAVAGALVTATAAKTPTPVETAEYRATPSYDETLAFLRQLCAKQPALKLDSFGKSAMGRALPLVIVSGDRLFTPAAAARSGKPIVMIQSGIHAGEIDGKDASLMLLRDLADGRHHGWLDRLVLLVVPIYNVDGHERVSPYNRPNQNGPEAGMGFRTTADGHDLNRDHLKLCTPEARALIGLVNAWRPHLHVDDHVTDGSDHDWVLTYAWVEGPQVAPSIDAWLSQTMPRVIAATEASGHRLGPYVDLLDPQDPAKGFTSYVGTPRYATGYFPLRNRPSILVETHSYKPYRARVLANRAFLEALLDAVTNTGRALLDAVRQAEEATVALGRADAPASDVVVRYKAAAPTDTIRFPIYDWTVEPSIALGTPLLRYRPGQVHEIDAPWQHRPEIELAVRRPRGYLVLPGWPEIERRLADHGLRVERLDAPAEVDVETLRLSNPREAGTPRRSYQGLTQLAADVERRRERRAFPAGSLWIPADQADFAVAVQLLEPEAPDSLVSWGLLSIVFERKEWMDSRGLEARARTLLEDPAIAEAWRQALADPAFAADEQARYAWWYRRTPYWDESIGLLPVMRVMAPVQLATSPWN
ncbi:MAG TPA: M14 family metallopeptidase [Candidatus Polarisedimenticolaceae bacterium]|nr:M14 family metallopeptidase [Candidatus Polarisedimenticolaceae bacterium]